MKTLNLHIYPSPMTHESRILKITKSISDANYVDEIYLIGMWSEGLREVEQIDSKRQIWRVRARIGTQKSSLILKFIRYIEWQLRIIWKFRKCHIKIVNCHSLPVLPVCVCLKLMKKSLLVYDTHELETDVVGTKAKKCLYTFIERAMIRYSDIVITVSESIAEWYKAKYNLPIVTTVRNIPMRQNDENIVDTNILKSKFMINENEILYIFQGILCPGRGIDIMLEAFARVNKRNHIVFMGFGECQEKISKYSKIYPNIHYHEAVKQSEIRNYTGSADVGLCIQENLGLNYYYSLPNKLFEYIMSGLPVIASDFPELKKVIVEYECGWTMDVNVTELVNLLNKITIEEILIKKEKMHKYLRKIGWQEEEKKMLQAYQLYAFNA